MAVSIVSIVFEVMTRDTAKELMKSIEGNKSVLLSGIEKVYENPSQFLADYASIMRQTEDRVDILFVPSISLHWMLDFERVTIDALMRGVRFRVLMPSPDPAWISFLSEVEATTYAREAGHSIERWRDMESKAQRFKPTGQLTGQLEVRTYNDSPGAFIMITDDLLSFAPYLQSNFRISSPCIQVRAKADLIYQPYKRYFERVWIEALEAVELYDQKK